MICRACKHDHDPMITCGRAARIRERALPCAELVVHEVVHEVVHAKSRHGAYADPEKRKAYRREWARKDRASKRA